MKIMLSGLRLAAVLLLCGCNHKPSATSNTSNLAPSIDEGISGLWTLHMGKALDTLTLTDKNGVITGTIKVDSRWDGGTLNINGIRIGDKIELTYFNPAYGNYSFKGNVEKDKMSGSFRVTSTADEALWVAERK